MYYWQRCIITEKTGFAFKYNYYWQVGYIHDKSDEMRVRLLTEFFWGRQVWRYDKNMKFNLTHSIQTSSIKINCLWETEQKTHYYIKQSN